MIRLAVIADATAIAGVESVCFGTNAWNEGLIAGEIGSDRHVVLVSDDLAAYGAISLADDVADLDRIAVLPAQRGQGRARDLLADLVHRARDLGVARMLLEVAADNPVAIGLYESVGFDTISTRPGYYHGGVDALVMELGIEEWR